jgi:hypothetical protein
MSSTKTTKVTAYGQFYDAVSNEVRSKNPTVKDIRKIVSEMWKNADNQTKEEYKQIAAKAKGDAVPAVPGAPAAPVSKPKKKSDKPLSAFMQYTNEVRNKVREENPDMKMPEISKVIGQMWKDLGEEGKKPYFDRYKAEAEAKAAEAKSPQGVDAETQTEPPKAVTIKSKPGKPKSAEGAEAPKADAEAVAEAVTEAIAEAAQVVPENVVGKTEAAEAAKAAPKAAPKSKSSKAKPDN